MRLILSRKGFDSSAGGVASPILDDGTMFSLPIPSVHSPIRYRDITLGGQPLARVVPALTRGALTASSGAHLDPDVVPQALGRRGTGWRGLFGQAGTAQVILARAGVGPGDLFLFFGWFRRTEEHHGTLRYVKGAPDVHVLWGWMQIDHVLDVATRAAKVPRWARYHPHVAGDEPMTKNTLYVARERLSLDGVDVGLPGAGVFARFDDRLVLTRPGASRSRWSLPSWFAPRGRPPLGAHGDPTRWRLARDRVHLQSVARGQEFTLDLAHYPEATTWLGQTFAVADGARATSGRRG